MSDPVGVVAERRDDLEDLADTDLPAARLADALLELDEERG